MKTFSEFVLFCSVGFVGSAGVCLMVAVMHFLGLGEPNLSEGITLGQFYVALFCYTLAAFPLAGLALASLTLACNMIFRNKGC
jgi:ABC-type dipeptide/oligopeptide/nickel transport system permease subunit